MNDTPRTDSKLHAIATEPETDYQHAYSFMERNTDGEWVPADFARGLEREIAILRASLSSLLETVKRMRNPKTQEDVALMIFKFTSPMEGA